MAFRYEALEVWPLALEYVDACFIVADGLPQRVQFSLGEQIRKAATSVIANIAEGSGKSTSRSERNFYDIARGSLAETVGLLALCQRRGYLPDDKHRRMYNRANVVSAMLWGLIKAQDARMRDDDQTYTVENAEAGIAEPLAAYAADAHDLADFFFSNETTPASAINPVPTLPTAAITASAPHPSAPHPTSTLSNETTPASAVNLASTIRDEAITASASPASAPYPTPGTVYFVGAGPGAPDLITVRGRTIIEQADLVLYADSLVPEIVANLARKPDVRIVGSADLHLEQMVALMVTAAQAGEVVARVHTGDPALYGATHEQMRLLDAQSVPYAVVPGVTAAFATAARLAIELTIPDIVQTVILSRVAGRTPVPEQEGLRSLAAHGASLALYLSIGQIEQVVAELLAGGSYTAETPVAVAYRVTWPDERIITGTLADIAAQVRAAGLTRHALILVGPALRSADFPTRSRLYDADFGHGYRRRCEK